MTLDNDAILKMLEQFEKESEAFTLEALRFVWFMRGGLDYDTAFQLTQFERDSIHKLIEDNFETTKKTGLPFF